MKKWIAILLMGFGTLAYGQGAETRALGAFDELSVGEAIDVYITKGNKDEAKIVTKYIDSEKVLTEVSGGKLRIHMENGNWRKTDVKVYLTYKNLQSLSVSSAASVISENVVTADNFEVSCSSSGSAKLELDVQFLEVDVSSSGDVEARGKAVKQDIRVSSAGDYYGFDVVSDEVYVRASSAGSAKVTASKILDAKANSAGSIRYKGNPDKEYVSSTSGGSAKRYND